MNVGYYKQEERVAAGTMAELSINIKARISFWLIAVILATVDAWRYRFRMTDDGLAYLDIADAYLRGDWINAINAYWSPLYSWILAVALYLARPSGFWESSLVHFVNVGILLCALAAFEFFIRELLLYQHRLNQRPTQQGLVGLPENAFVALAYVLFIWSSLMWITVPIETPDMLLSVFIYLAAGLLLRIYADGGDRKTFAVLGAVLAIGYLAKSAMFLMTWIILGIAFFAETDLRRSVKKVLIALVVFLTLAAPYVMALSLAKGRLTFGDSGRLVYAWFVNDSRLPQYHWGREFPDDKRPKHPTEKVLESPALYAYDGSPVGGAYPLWYDPSYWHEGVKPEFTLRGQLRAIYWSTKDYMQLLLAENHFLVIGAFVLIFVGNRRWKVLQDIGAYKLLLILSLAALCMYGIVHVQPRYVAAYIVVLWLAMFSGLRLSDSIESRRLFRGVVGGMILLMALQLAPKAYALVNIVRYHQSYEHIHWEIAQGLERMGVKAGDKVARIGYGPNAYWARLAGVRVVAELFSPTDEFESVEGVWALFSHDGSWKSEALQAFAKTGAKAIVANEVPAFVSRHEWKRLGQTNWFGYLLPR